MGKDLKGKELGVGICQRKDGLYTARFTCRDGKRKQKYFKKLQECRKWIADAQFEDEHGNINASLDMTVSAWFDYWIENIKSANVKYNTVRNYRERFKYNIEPYIGNMLLSDVKPLHCQNILHQMFSSAYKDSTIGLTKITMKTLFNDAVDNGLIERNPVTKSVKSVSRDESNSKRAMTVDEQRAFLKTAIGSSYYSQYAFILQTGLRTGELAGLKWCDVDFRKKCICVSRTMDYRGGKWIEGSPKSKSGRRTVFLTNEAIKILREVKTSRKSNIILMDYHDFVFLSRNGKPILNSAYNVILKRLCKKAGIEPFSMHELRHTFATRCIESGMTPKILQEIMGHANIGVTMDIYVHVTEGTKKKEMDNAELALSII